MGSILNEHVAYPRTYGLESVFITSRICTFGELCPTNRFFQNFQYIFNYFLNFQSPPLGSILEFLFIVPSFSIFLKNFQIFQNFQFFTNFQFCQFFQNLQISQKSFEKIENLEKIEN